MIITQDILLLSVTALSIGFIHTIVGPDHYLPFVMMGKAGKWSCSKTIIITFFSGIGHVLSSVILGLIGVLLGISVSKLQLIEGFRGNVAAWLLIGFGFMYFLWGIKMVFKNRPHKHIHLHEDGEPHHHEHNHVSEHAHPHEGKNLTPWILFTIFVFGPCEPLIPILMYPAANSSYFGLFLVTLVFGLTTISTMVAIVALSYYGFNLLPFQRFERYMHPISGAAICISGLAIQFLGL